MLEEANVELAYILLVLLLTSLLVLEEANVELAYILLVLLLT